jgi:hypothetical protein
MCILPILIEEKETLLQLFHDPRLLESQQFQQRLPEFTERLLHQVCQIDKPTQILFSSNMRIYQQIHFVFQGMNEVVNSRQKFYSSLCTLRDTQHFVSLFESDIHSTEFQSELWLSVCDFIILKILSSFSHSIR